MPLPVVEPCSPPASRHLILVTAGHVDHGKTSLVRALTGIDPDRLPEEKARGITLDLGFAHLRLEDARESFHLAIIDVPGHEDLVRNMAAGVGSANLGLLVIAADEGWMPQTEEHLQILTYYRVPKLVIALTKIDRSPREAVEAIMGAVAEKIAGTLYAGAPIVPMSTVNGQGLEDLKRTLLETAGALPPHPDIGKPRLPVDRVFTLPGVGTVVTGVLTGGILTRGQAVLLQPSGILSRIRSIQSYNLELERVGPGRRAALNLIDVAVGGDRNRRGEKKVVCRGDVVTTEGLGTSSHVFDSMLELPVRTGFPGQVTPCPALDRTNLQLHIGTAAVPATLRLAKRNHATAGAFAQARIRVKTPVFALVGDRFILRDPAGHATVAGGVVLDPAASGPGFATDRRQLFLERKAASVSDAKPSLAAEVNWRQALRRDQLLVSSPFSPAELEACVSELAAQGQVRVLGEWVLDSAWWQGISERAGAEIDLYHKVHPGRPGLPLVDLRACLRLDPRLPAEVFDLLCRQLACSGWEQVGNSLRRAAHRPTLPQALENAAAGIRARLAGKPLEPPLRGQLAPDEPACEALRFLVQSGEVVPISETLVLLAGAFQAATATVRAYLQTHTSGTVSELRQALGATRRVVVPLLEKLDRERVTRREGDRRFLCGPAPKNS
jgi:selenocysteine-specific elongation factor